jgi:hypothetical protein
MTRDQEFAAMPSIAKIGSILPQVIEYLPLLSLVRAVGASATPDAKAAAVMGVLKFVASRTSTPLDNEFLDRLEPCLKTREVMEFLMWLADRAEAIVEGDKIARQMQGA